MIHKLYYNTSFIQRLQLRESSTCLGITLMDAPKLHKVLLKLALPITHGIVNALGSFYLKGIFF
jgi:hypothetical protein